MNVMIANLEPGHIINICRYKNIICIYNQFSLFYEEDERLSNFIVSSLLFDIVIIFSSE